MRAVLIAAIACLSATARVQAESTEEKAPRSRYSQLHDDWKRSKEDLKTRSGETGFDLTAELEELNARYTERFVELAESSLDDEDQWVQVMVWMAVEGVDGEHFDEAMVLLRENAGRVREGAQLQLLMSEFIVRPSDEVGRCLRHLSETHPSPGVKGAAVYAHAAWTKRRAEQIGSVALASEAERLLDLVLSDHPDVHTYRGKNRDNAERLLSELRSPFALGKPAPDIEGIDTGDVPFKLADHRGKVVVLAFSGHWCGPCRVMHSYERDLVRRHAGDPFLLVEINSDKDEEALVREMLAKGLTWPCICEEGSDGPISTAWRIDAWPTFVVLDPDHVIRHRVTDAPREELAKWVEDLLAERSHE